MKAILHIGLPKSGSTSIQNCLRNNHEQLLAQTGLWFRRFDNEFNDAKLFDYSRPYSAHCLDAFIFAKVTEADREGAEVVVFSAERLGVSSVDDIVLPIILRLRRQVPDVEVIILVRDLKRWMRSHILQLMNNATTHIENGLLGLWICEQVKAIWNLPCKVTSLSFDKVTEKGELISRFIQVATGRSIKIPDVVANRTPGRPLQYQAMLGVMSRLRAAVHGYDINSAEADAYRDTINEAYDNYFAVNDRDDIILTAVREFSEMMAGAIDEYIALSSEIGPHQVFEFYESLCQDEVRDNDYDVREKLDSERQAATRLARRLTRARFPKGRKTRSSIPNGLGCLPASVRRGDFIRQKRNIVVTGQGLSNTTAAAISIAESLIKQDFTGRFVSKDRMLRRFEGPRGPSNERRTIRIFENIDFVIVAGVESISGSSAGGEALYRLLVALAGKTSVIIPMPDSPAEWLSSFPDCELATRLAERLVQQCDVIAV